jgi:hypothetical protein
LQYVIFPGLQTLYGSHQQNRRIEAGDSICWQQPYPYQPRLSLTDPVKGIEQKALGVELIGGQVARVNTPPKRFSLHVLQI